MFEELLEDIAQKNGLREVNTYLKLAAGLGGIILCLLSTSYLPPLFIAFCLSGAAIALARVDVRTYGELFILPLTFAIMSVLGIILITGGEGILWRWDALPAFTLSITKESINLGFFVFCRIIGGMSAMIFIALTTPMTEIFIILRQCRVPDVVIDLMMIIYRTIFSLFDHCVQIHRAQVMRLGYSTYAESLRSFSMLCGAVFIASWEAGEDLVRAMDARCYDGRFALLGETRPIESRPLIAVSIFIAISIVVVAGSGTMTILPV